MKTATDELTNRYEKARARVRDLRESLARRKAGHRCRRGMHELQGHKVVCGGGISKASLEEQLGKELPEAIGWGGYQVCECIVCHTWLLYSYCHEGETVITKTQGMKLAR